MTERILLTLGNLLALAAGRRAISTWAVALGAVAEPELWWYEILPDPFGSCNEHADRVAEHLGEVIPRTR